MAIKMMKCFDGSEISEREMAAMSIPGHMMPMTPEEREEYERLQQRIPTSLTDSEHSEALLEAAAFVLRVITPQQLAMQEEARQIDRAEMAQQAREPGTR